MHKTWKTLKSNICFFLEKPQVNLKKQKLKHGKVNVSLNKFDDFPEKKAKKIIATYSMNCVHRLLKTSFK